METAADFDRPASKKDIFQPKDQRTKDGSFRERRQRGRIFTRRPVWKERICEQSDAPNPCPCHTSCCRFAPLHEVRHSQGQVIADVRQKYDNLNTSPFMKATTILFLTFNMFCACVHASDNIYELKYIITNKDGSRSDGNALFLTDDSISLPIDLDIGGLCVLTCIPIVEENPSDKAKKFKEGLFRIQMTAGSTGAEMKQIFNSRLPISMGKEVHLFKSHNQALSVQISEVTPEK